MNGGALLWARTDVRRRWTGLVFLALLAGLGAGVVLTAVAGVRRTESALDRALEATATGHVLIQANVVGAEDVALDPTPGHRRGRYRPLRRRGGWARARCRCAGRRRGVRNALRPHRPRPRPAGRPRRGPRGRRHTGDRRRPRPLGRRRVHAAHTQPTSAAGVRDRRRHRVHTPGPGGRRRRGGRRRER